MRFKRYTTGVAIAALLAGSAYAQTPGQSPIAAGTLNPASEEAPTRTVAAPEFRMADGIVATVNDSIITGYDLRQRMLLVIAMTQVQPTDENIQAIQQEALNVLIDERLQAQEIATYKDLIVSDAEVDAEIAAMAQEVGTNPETYLGFLAQGGIRPQTVREQLRVSIGWRSLVGGRFARRNLYRGCPRRRPATGPGRCQPAGPADGSGRAVPGRGPAVFRGPLRCPRR